MQSSQYYSALSWMPQNFTRARKFAQFFHGFRCRFSISNLTDKLELLPVKLPESILLLQDGENIRQIMHQEVSSRQQTPRKAPDLPVAWHEGCEERQKLCTSAHYCQNSMN